MQKDDFEGLKRGLADATAFANGDTSRGVTKCVVSGHVGIVHKDADSDYGISFPGLPGCFSSGETLEELERNARMAITLYLEADQPKQEGRL